MAIFFLDIDGTLTYIEIERWGWSPAENGTEETMTSAMKLSLTDETGTERTIKISADRDNPECTMLKSEDRAFLAKVILLLVPEDESELVIEKGSKYYRMSVPRSEVETSLGCAVTTMLGIE